jgi:hypothetical protein
MDRQSEPEGRHLVYAGLTFTKTNHFGGPPTVADVEFAKICTTAELDGVLAEVRKLGYRCFLHVWLDDPVYLAKLVHSGVVAQMNLGPTSGDKKQAA